MLLEAFTLIDLAHACSYAAGWHWLASVGELSAQEITRIDSTSVISQIPCTQLGEISGGTLARTVALAEPVAPFSYGSNGVTVLCHT